MICILTIIQWLKQDSKCCAVLLSRAILEKLLFAFGSLFEFCLNRYWNYFHSNVFENLLKLHVWTSSWNLTKTSFEALITSILKIALPINIRSLRPSAWINTKYDNFLFPAPKICTSGPSEGLKIFGDTSSNRKSFEWLLVSLIIWLSKILGRDCPPPSCSDGPAIDRLPVKSVVF